ncbi:MAG: acetyl-CoA carboxylase biotin carboxyl carrier protein [Verrucomicrobium sp.]|nr:acetyl-CoA carboxylase biotin carboxyl carrier protein [Verrucomicrobium sp.]
MDLKEIKGVIDLMTKNGISEFELEQNDFKIRLKKGQNPEISAVSPHSAPVFAHAPHPASAPAPAPAAAPVPAAPAENVKPIVSPMVGTFYSAPSPDSAPYVKVGQEVNEDTVVCIIEAMKVMNEIKAEVKGVVTEIIAENGKPVDFNKPLFNVKVS